MRGSAVITQRLPLTKDRLTLVAEPMLRAEPENSLVAVQGGHQNGAMP